MFAISVYMARVGGGGGVGVGGGPLSWQVAKPDVCCVTPHSTEPSQPLAELGICMS